MISEGPKGFFSSVVRQWSSPSTPVSVGLRLRFIFLIHHLPYYQSFVPVVGLGTVGLGTYKLTTEYPVFFEKSLLIPFYNSTLLLASNKPTWDVY